MRFDKEKAFELRRNGKSYKAIQMLLGMSISTLSDWFKDEEWSKEIKHRLASEASAKNSSKLTLMQQARRKKLDTYYKEAKDEAISEYKAFSRNPLFIAGIMIYLGEGDKLSKYRCGISNTEPRMLNIFSRFLQEIGRIDRRKIKVWILLYPDLDDITCRKYWAEASGLSEANFSKSITIKGKSAIRRLNYGVCNMAVYNRYFKEKMLTWLQLTSEGLAS